MSGSSSYDNIAEMYHALWMGAYLPGALPALERLFFCQVPARSRVLDLCCGSGHVTGELVMRGYSVTGVDNSAGLLEFARREAPQAGFILQDARHLSLEKRFDAAISTFDSLNHILSLEDLQAVFSGVYQALENGGLFVFDMNLEEAYLLDLHQWTVNIRKNAVGLSRGTYDRTTHTAQTELLWFTQEEPGGCWRRRDSIVEQRCYPKEDIVRALELTGFGNVEVYSARDLKVDPDFGHGRYFFSARRP